MKENSIEEDINRCNKLIETTANWIGISNQLAIKHILSDYKRVLKENETLKQINAEAWEEWNDLEQSSYETEQRLKKEIEELKSNKTLVEKILDKGKGFTLQQTQYIWEHYIPVQKIKDIIDRIDYDIKKTKAIISNDRKNNYQIIRLKAMNTKSLYIKKRLQKLLESE